jgi:hypothetical protein
MMVILSALLRDPISSQTVWMRQRKPTKPTTIRMTRTLSPAPSNAKLTSDRGRVLAGKVGTVVGFIRRSSVPERPI